MHVPMCVVGYQSQMDDDAIQLLIRQRRICMLHVYVHVCSAFANVYYLFTPLTYDISSSGASYYALTIHRVTTIVLYTFLIIHMYTRVRRNDMRKIYAYIVQQTDEMNGKELAKAQVNYDACHRTSIDCHVDDDAEMQCVMR